MIGVDPMPLTLRSLVRMSEAKRAEAWSRLSCLLALIYNAHRAKGAALKAKDFNPYASSGDDVMVLNRNEAKELFKVMAKHVG